MKIHNNQRVDNLRPEIQLAIRLLDLLSALVGTELQITWTTGGTHKQGSLHLKRRAFDALPVPDEMLKNIRLILGPDYDIINEGDHLHCEWDPK